MRSSTLLSLFILDTAVLAVPGNVLLRVPVAAAKCNKDNCFNVMLNTPSVAATFCSTFIQTTKVTTVTPVVYAVLFPSHVACLLTGI
jgi:hypothetical protein